MLYDKGNYIGMKNDMGKINWSKAFKDCEQNVEEQYRIFLTELKKLEKKYIPTRHYSGPSKTVASDYFESVGDGGAKIHLCDFRASAASLNFSNFFLI